MLRVIRSGISPNYLDVGNEDRIQFVVHPNVIGQHWVRLKALPSVAAKFDAFMAKHNYTNCFVEHFARLADHEDSTSSVEWGWASALTPPARLQDRDAEHVPFRVAKYRLTLSQSLLAELIRIKTELMSGQDIQHDEKGFHYDNFVLEVDADIPRAPLEIFADQSIIEPSKHQDKIIAGPVPLRVLRLFKMNFGPTAEALLQPATKAIELQEIP